VSGGDDAPHGADDGEPRESFVQTARGRFCISTDRRRVDAVAAHAYLVHSYWSPGIPLDTVRRAIDGSLCFGVYDEAGAQVGFARVVTDHATFAYLCDVYVLESHRGLALGKALIGAVTQHPTLQSVRRAMLATRDAHTLYAASGFRALASPDVFMEINRPDIYRSGR
jgi:GNAT superfamily N-acetyltransferase